MDELRLRLFEDDLPVPGYKTAGAAGFDLYTRVTMDIAPGAIAYVPLNVAIEPPKGFWIQLCARSSLHKRGLMMGNGVGILDQDFVGDTDEYKAILYNFSDAIVTIERGERLVQAVVLPLHQVKITQVSELGNDSRGGIGTTGRH